MNGALFASLTYALRPGDSSASGYLLQRIQSVTTLSYLSECLDFEIFLFALGAHDGSFRGGGSLRLPCI